MNRFILGVLSLLAIALLASASGLAQENASLCWIDPIRGSHLQELDVPLNQERDIRLVAVIPADKILKAYNITVVYDGSIVKVLKALPVSGHVLSPKYVNTISLGSVTFNGFDVQGVAGVTEIPLMDIALKGTKKGGFQTIIAPNSFGSSAEEQFIPLTQEITVTVR